MASNKNNLLSYAAANLKICRLVAINVSMHRVIKFIEEDETDNKVEDEDFGFMVWPW